MDASIAFAIAGDVVVVPEGCPAGIADFVGDGDGEGIGGDGSAGCQRVFDGDDIAACSYIAKGGKVLPGRQGDLLLNSIRCRITQGNGEVAVATSHCQRNLHGFIKAGHVVEGMGEAGVFQIGFDRASYYEFVGFCEGDAGVGVYTVVGIGDGDGVAGNCSAIVLIASQSAKGIYPGGTEGLGVIGDGGIGRGDFQRVGGYSPAVDPGSYACVFCSEAADVFAIEGVFKDCVLRRQFLWGRDADIGKGCLAIAVGIGDEHFVVARASVGEGDGASGNIAPGKPCPGTAVEPAPVCAGIAAAGGKGDRCKTVVADDIIGRATGHASFFADGHGVE